MWEKRESQTFTAVTNPEREHFYEEINRFADRNHVELAMLEGYGKYRVWKGFFGSGFFQIIFMVGFIGLVEGVDHITNDAGLWTGRIIVLSILAAALWVSLHILWKVFRLLTWPIRLIHEFGGHSTEPWWIGYENPTTGAGGLFWVLFSSGLIVLVVIGWISIAHQ